MKSIRLLPTLSLLIAALLPLGGSVQGAPPPTSAALFVVPGGAGDGSSWDNAKDLGPALSGATNGQELWVKSGTYRPAGLNGDRNATFQLKSGVALYGGFAGTEMARTQRNPAPATNGTVLSGDLNGNDGASFANHGENTYHVVTGSGTDATAVLDGFTVVGGNANGDNFPNFFGGGMLNEEGSPTLTNVTFSGNSASDSGGGIYNLRSSRPALRNCILWGDSRVVGQFEIRETISSIVQT